jgi:hypothetical protein
MLMFEEEKSNCMETNITVSNVIAAPLNNSWTLRICLQMETRRLQVVITTLFLLFFCLDH